MTDECGSAGNGLMEIVGIAPEGAAEVRLRFSDGSYSQEPVVEGTFKFDGQNPSQDAPYPTGVQWETGGIWGATAPLPVHGDEFCEPAN